MSPKSRALILSILIAATATCPALAQFGDGPLRWTISGSTGIPGVRMTGLPDAPITDSSGKYSARVPYGWSGIVKPAKAGYTFDPSSRTYPKVTEDKPNQDYKASVIGLAVSGKLLWKGEPIEGVLLEAGKYGPSDKTDEKGRYSIALPYNWTGKIELAKEGLDLKSWSMTFKDLTRNQVMPDIDLSNPQHAISGSVGIPGVTMQGLPGNPVSDPKGHYSALVPHGFSGTVTPTKEGYVFEPASISYAKVDTACVNQNHIASLIQLRISGSTGVPGVKLNGLPTPVTSLPDGTYTANVPYGWSGVIIPAKEGYAFAPSSKPYVKIVTNQPNQDYTTSIIQFKISGSTGIQGVTMQGLPGNVVTDARGFYQATVEYGWTGTVRPEKPDYTFDPPQMQYDTVRADQINQNYQAKPQTLTISGQVIIGGSPVEDMRFTVETRDTGEVVAQAATDDQGRYSFKVPYGWSGKVTPTKSGWAFDPPYQEYTNLTTNIVNGDPVPTEILISGSVVIPGVTMQGLPGNVTSDTRGQYVGNVEYGWSGTVRPTKPGFNFQPVSKEYRSVVGSHHGENYTAVAIPDEASATSVRVTIIPTTKVDPQQFTTLTQDIRTMLHILNESLLDQSESGGIFSDFGPFFGIERRDPEALYIQGYGAILLLAADLQLAPPPAEPPQEPNQPKADVDPVWRQAQERLYPQAFGGMAPWATLQAQSTPKTLDEIKADLIETLKHASNIQFIDPNELVIVTVTSSVQQQFPGAFMFGGTFSPTRSRRSSIRSGSGGGFGMGGYGGASGGSGGAGGSRMMGGGMGGYGGTSGGSASGGSGSAGATGGGFGMGGYGGGGYGGSVAGGGASFGGASGGFVTGGVVGGSGMMGGAAGIGGGMMGGGMGMGGFGGSSAPSQTSPVTITIRAKKADIDDFAQDVIDLETFKEKLSVFTY